MTNILIKERIVFLLGFGAGFCLTLMIYLMKYSITEIPDCDNKLLSDITNERNNFDNNKLLSLSRERVKFGIWLTETSETLAKSQNTENEDINMNYYEYEKKSDKPMESTWLMNKVKITCVIFVEKLKLAKAISDTWGTRCNKLYFFGKDLQDSSLPVIKFNVKLTSSWQLLCESMNYIWNQTKNNETNQEQDLEWIIFIKDDMMVLPENLRYIVAPLNYNDDYYLGHAVTLWGQDYNVAEAGYVLSKSAFKKIVQKFDNSLKCASSGKFWKKEDFYLGKHLSSLGIYPSDTRDTYKRGTFHGYSLQILFWGIAKPGQYWTRALYPPGSDCCSPRSVTFNAVDSSKIYTLNYLLYRFNTFLKPTTHKSKSSLKITPDDEVWKKVLKDEFGIENITEITNEQYYQLWRKKYSEPETFMKKQFYNPLSSS